ncbi:keratin-associated protein 5-5-like [Actinia tenebrosa]|uniref:Keratin-associated protein 5-5-like n=1 Tax=Actinia tenebrosa TaxID=6105 RepID=A0A6P8HRR9_ACTTE|nr:keratin-associated protein 5-5-like [Actinia tenebrosa]
MFQCQQAKRCGCGCGGGFHGYGGVEHIYDGGFGHGGFGGHGGCGCGASSHGGSWGVCDLCHHNCHDDGWCGAGCMCGNCCGGFGHPKTNHGCNSGCCPSVTFPCTFGACVNNPCCECCREPAPKGKCKWPCLWPCCCECTPPKFKFKPLKPKPVCHCPHSCDSSPGHKRSADVAFGMHRRFAAPYAPSFVRPSSRHHGYRHYGYRSFLPRTPYPYMYGHHLPYY